MTHDTDAALRRGYDALLAARERAARERSDAPPAVPLERMLALVEGRGSEHERLETLDAVMADAASAREFELLRALAANREPAPPATLPRRWAMWVLPSSLAAAAALTLVALPTLRRPTTDGPDVVRGVVQGAAVLLAPPLEASAAESRTFRWHAVPGAQRYAVEILTAGGTPVFTTRVADTTVTLPADVHLAPGVEHRWWVATELADGTQRRSAFRRLLVRESR
jgi:hypothetical protein